MADIALRDSQDALDVVQDAMIQLATKYVARPPLEWKPLFYRILKNRIRDCQRRRRTRSKVIAWWPMGSADDEGTFASVVDEAPSPDTGPAQRLENEQAMAALSQALRELPHRQREVFCLRLLEGMNVADTAAVMGCSDGSVKTHYFRALKALREKLGEHWL